MARPSRPDLRARKKLTLIKAVSTAPAATPLDMLKDALHEVAAAWTQTWAGTEVHPSGAELRQGSKGLWTAAVHMGDPLGKGMSITYRHTELHVAVDLLCVVVRRQQPFIAARDEGDEWNRWQRVERACQRAVRLATEIAMGPAKRRARVRNRSAG